MTIDIIGDLARRMDDGGLSVTHAAHPAVASRIFVAGAGDLQPYDMIVRRREWGVVFDGEIDLDWVALHMRLPPCRTIDLIIEGRIATGMASAVVRATWPDGRSLDGERAALGNAGPISTAARLQSAKDMDDAAALEAILVIDGFSLLDLRRLELHIA